VEKHISDLGVKVVSAEACSVEIATKGEKSLRDFQGAFNNSSECTICMLREFKASEVCV
jgi:hypothetical protein